MDLLKISKKVTGKTLRTQLVHSSIFSRINYVFQFTIYLFTKKYTGGSQQKLPLLRIHNKISIDQMVGMTRKSITRHLAVGL